MAGTESMRETPKTVCDQCGADLTVTGYAGECRAVITSEAMPSRGGPVFSMEMGRPVDRDHHFCDMNCLAVWVATMHPKAADIYAWRMEREAKVRAQNIGPVGSE